MSRRRVRTQSCGTAEARTRVGSAVKFLEVARLIESEEEGAFRSVAASMAVLAGIAATDAACCFALGRRSRGADHRDAEALVSDIAPNGTQAAAWLRRLIDLKDTAQYGIIYVSRDDLKVAMRQAERLVEFADEVIRR